MTPCAERFLAGALIIIGVLALFGLNKLPLLLIVVPVSLLLACVLASSAWLNEADSGWQKR